MTRCPVCLVQLNDTIARLSDHFYALQLKNDADHIMWLNRYIGKQRFGQDELELKFEKFFRTASLKKWIISNFVRKFYGNPPHMFILEMQHPKEYVLRGYAMEHHHFLKQWVRSCASIISNTDIEDVQAFEIENIVSEWYGAGENRPSHHELLLRMGESLGVSRDEIYGSEPLPATKKAVEAWSMMSRDFTFVEGMTAMHSLELIASRKIREYGASMGYFDPVILKDGSITEDAANFLREGYNADVSHSETALDLIEKYSKEMRNTQDCQAVFLKSIEVFDDYLNARLERGMMLEDKQQ